MHLDKITLVGVGLLGGSLGLAAKQRGLARRVEGYVRRPASIAESVERGAVDQATCDLAAAVSGADLVVLCTPLAQMRGLAEAMAPALKKEAIVTDVGSAKAEVARELEPVIGAAGGCFVGSHPMAGAEKMGVGAARADLFHRAVCVITPTAASPEGAVELLENFWRLVGARPIRLSPEEHDRLVSRASHLPHVVAAELARQVLAPEYPSEQRLLCANGFRDTTRIASGSPEMWRDIALANRRNLHDALEDFIAGLKAFQASLSRGDSEAIQAFFEKAKRQRDEWCGRHASPSPE